MYSESELMSVYDFCKQTPEGSLKKMLVSGRMTEAHFRVFLKVVRAVSGADFVQMANNGNLPKIKLNAQEMALKETLWGICLSKCEELGLLSKAVAAA